MKSPVLYHDTLSYPSQIARLAMAEKGVRVSWRRVDEARAGQLRPRFLKLNTQGALPVLDHNGIVLDDVITICLYINNNFPGPMLVPNDSAAREEMETWIRLSQQFPESEYFISPIASKRGRRGRGRLVRQKKAVKQLKSKYPAFEEVYTAFAETAQKQLSRSTNKKFIERTRDRLDEMLDVLDQGLKTKTWLAGSDYSLADVMWTVLLARLDYCGQSNLWSGGKRVNVEVYYERVRKRSSFAKAQVIRKASLFGPSSQFVRSQWAILTLGAVGAAFAGYLATHM